MFHNSIIEKYVHSTENKWKLNRTLLQYIQQGEWFNNMQTTSKIKRRMKQIQQQVI